MLKIKAYLFLLAIIFVCATPLHAASTPAGTVISNQAQLKYSINGIQQTAITSNSADFTVLEVVNVVLVSLDSGAVRVSTPQLNAPLTFSLNNTGNGTQTYDLSRINNITGDQFDPSSAATAIFIESGLLAGFQATGPNADTVYTAGSNSVSVAAGGSKIVYVVSDIPSALAIGNEGTVELSAKSRILGLAGSTPGSTHPNISVIGQTSTVLAVTGLTRGQASAPGSYRIDGVIVKVTKTIVSPSDANNLIPGTEMIYSLLVKVEGVGTVQNLVVNDPIPAQLSYVAGSMTVDNAPRTDAVDTDNAQFSSNTVTVKLGDVTAPKNYDIKFRTTLK